MAILKAACVFALAISAVSGAVHLPRQDDEPTVTVTVTETPAPPPDVVITQVVTRSVYTTREFVSAYLNCTQNVFAPQPTPTETEPPPTDPSSTEDVETGMPTTAPTPIPKRQDDPPEDPETETVTITAEDRPARTRTQYVLQTETQTAAQTQTRYACAATVAYLYTVDTTMTVSRTRTAYETTITAYSTISCRGGFPGFPPPPPPSAPPPSVPATTTPAPSPTSVDPKTLVSKRQVETLSDQGTISTQTVHITRTAYTVVTESQTGASVNVAYVCSSTVYDTVVIPRTRTAFLSTATEVSAVECPGGQTMVPRQDDPPPPAPTTSDNAIHATRYVYSTVVLTESVTTRSIYECASAPLDEPSPTPEPGPDADD